MAEPRTGEATTANYGWVKPTVGASADAWGGYVNADLDSIDSTVHGIQASVPASSLTTPLMDRDGGGGIARDLRPRRPRPPDRHVALRGVESEQLCHGCCCGVGGACAVGGDPHGRDRPHPRRHHRLGGEHARGLCPADSDHDHAGRRQGRWHDNRHFGRRDFIDGRLHAADCEHDRPRRGEGRRYVDHHRKRRRLGGDSRSLLLCADNERGGRGGNGTPGRAPITSIRPTPAARLSQARLSAAR